MTKEDKELLTLDLCGRLPYKLYCDASNWTDDAPRLILEFCPYYDEELKVTELAGRLPVEYCRPYLRPLSSMTKEEYEEYEKIENGMSNIGSKYRYYDLCDWYNKHHFDYRGLIEKGLAVEALEDMYKPKKS
jgi:hypothetical protein